MKPKKVSRRILAATIAEKILAEPEKRSHWLLLGAAYLVEQRQTDRVTQLVGDISREIYRQSGMLLASVTSAHPLENELKSDLEKYLRQVTGAKNIFLDESVDANLLSGIVATTPDAELNTSGRYRLRQIASIGKTE